ALRLLLDGKTSRPVVCNALETLLVHRGIAAEFLPMAAAALRAKGVEIRGDEATRELVPDALPATGDDYAAEFLGLVIAVRVVDPLDAAISHIRRFGSDHTQLTATRDGPNAARCVQARRSGVRMAHAAAP